MNEDRRRAEEYASDRDTVLRTWIASTVYPYSPVLRDALEWSGLGRRGVRGADDLGWLPTTSLADLADGRGYVLEPTAKAIAEHGPLVERVRLTLADVFGRRPELAREHVDPAHRPVLWTVSRHADGLLYIASTEADLGRLAEIGRRALSISGVRSDDRMLVLDPAGRRVGSWQLLAGARDGAIAALHADEPSAALVESAQPTVLAGRLSTLHAAVSAGLPASVRLLIVHDGPISDEENRSVLENTGLPVADWWWPPAARASWVRCPGGEGFHTWPTHEVVEVLDSHGRAAERGELVWSPVGWHGSVWMRVRTGVAVTVDSSTCRCGRTTPRVDPLPEGSLRNSPRRRPGEQVRA